MDTNVAAYETEKAILDRFGPDVRRTSQQVVAAGAVPNAALRSTYSDDAHGLTTESAFIQAGEWTVKLRMTGPSDADSDVKAAMTALIAQLHFDDAAAVRTASADPIQPCAAASKPGALCVRGTIDVAGSRFEMLQAAGASKTAAVLIPLNDAGKAMRFDRVEGEDGYRMSVQQIGRTDIYQTFDHLPSASTIARLIDNDGAQRLTSVATLTGTQ
jgi:hypothetical protein